jgi:hypothetical protein
MTEPIPDSSTPEPTSESPGMPIGDDFISHFARPGLIDDVQRSEEWRPSRETLEPDYPDYSALSALEFPDAFNDPDPSSDRPDS